MMTFSLYILAALLSQSYLVVGDHPFYNIAHMVNAVAQIDEWLEYGANALEADVTFTSDGKPEYFYHGIPCDAFRYCKRWSYIPNYVNAIRERTKPGSDKFNSNLVLMMFDVKLTKFAGQAKILAKAGEKFVESILIPLYRKNPTKMKVIISVPNLDLGRFIASVLRQLKAKRAELVEKVGFEISWEKKFEKPQELQRELERLGVAPGRAWLSKGATNWIPYLFLDELKELVAYRNNGNYFSKVYAWTVDKTSTVVQYLEIDLDGVIANYPGRVKEAIKEVNEKSGGHNKFRLATLDDDPFN